MAKVELWRHGLLEFLLRASLSLQLSPVVKYTALAFFAHRFLPSVIADGAANARSWLLRPLRESNLQLFALVSIWISSKVNPPPILFFFFFFFFFFLFCVCVCGELIELNLTNINSCERRRRRRRQLHDSRPLSVKSLKALGDSLIADQHFTSRDFADAELVFMEVLGYDIGASNIAFVYLEDLLVQFRELSKLGELVALDACTEIMDLLYETEDASLLFRAPYALAASTLVAAYLISVPEQRWEFPLLPWVKFVTSYDEEEIAEIVTRILTHVLQPEGIKQRIDEHILP